MLKDGQETKFPAQEALPDEDKSEEASVRLIFDN
jgi:hypothetical protein